MEKADNASVDSLLPLSLDLSSGAKIQNSRGKTAMGYLDAAGETNETSVLGEDV